MNDTSQPHQESGGTPPSTEHPAASSQQTPESGRCVFAPVACALRKGAEDAKHKAEETLPKVKAAVSKAAYHLAYGVAYAAVSHLAVLRAACPQTIQSGARDGARDGKAAGERFARWGQDAPEAAAPESASAASPSTG